MTKADWTRDEVEAIVDDYFAMLKLELDGEHYSKAEHRRELVVRLRARTHGSLERKHQNISAVLIDLLFPYISGYKPLHNYQKMLVDVVADYVRMHPELQNVLAAKVEAPFIRMPSSVGPNVVAPPMRETRQTEIQIETKRVYAGRFTNYVLREALNSSLGRAGEEYVFGWECERLKQKGLASLAEQVEWTSFHRGDGFGYDIKSYHEDGSETFIEVKTTRFGKETPFYVTPKEANFSKRESGHFCLYRLFDFRHEPGLYVVNGAIQDHFAIEPTQYLATIR